MKEKDDTKKESLKITALKLPESVHTEFKTIAAREGRDMQEIYTDLVKDYIKKHGNGNPAYALTEWIECPTMKSFPNFKRDPKEWQEYIEQFDEKTSKGNEELNDIETQAHIIKTFASNKIRYGTTNVRRY